MARFAGCRRPSCLRHEEAYEELAEAAEGLLDNVEALTAYVVGKAIHDAYKSV